MNTRQAIFRDIDGNFPRPSNSRLTIPSFEEFEEMAEPCTIFADVSREIAEEMDRDPIGNPWARARTRYAHNFALLSSQVVGQENPNLPFR